LCRGTDVIVLKIAFVTSDDEFEKATTPNMDAKVVGPARRGACREGQRCPLLRARWWDTIPIPAFFLHWEKAKVKEEDIPKEKGGPEEASAQSRRREKPAAKRANLFRLRSS